jgi:hypothetical protein
VYGAVPQNNERTGDQQGGIRGEWAARGGEGGECSIGGAFAGVRACVHMCARVHMCLCARAAALCGARRALVGSGAVGAAASTERCGGSGGSDGSDGGGDGRDDWEEGWV